MDNNVKNWKLNYKMQKKRIFNFLMIFLSLSKVSNDIPNDDQ